MENKKVLKPILKKDDSEYDDEAEKKVSFIDQKKSKSLCQYKPPTVSIDHLSMNVFEDEMHQISQCNNMDDLKIIKSQLEEEYTFIQNLKDNNEDISGPLKKFNKKLDMVEKVKFEIEQKLLLDQKIQKEKKLNLHNQTAVETRFDKLINCPIDLLILTDFQLFKPEILLYAIKEFLDSHKCQKIRIALSFQKYPYSLKTSFFDYKIEIEVINFERIDNNFYQTFDYPKCNLESIHCCLFFHIWTYNNEFMSTKWYQNNKNWIFPFKIDLNYGNFVNEFVEKIRMNYLSKFLEDVRLKKIIYALFCLKRENCLEKSLIKNNEINEFRKFLIVDDLSDPNKSKSQTSLKFNSLELIESHEIFLVEKKRSIVEKFTVKENIWLEYFPQMKTNWYFKNIHEITTNFVNLFNKNFNEQKIKIIEINFFYETTSKQTWYGVTKDNNSEKKEINTKFFNNSICQAFMHFCYIKSEKKFIIIDLGPRILNKDCVQFTDPVVQTKNYITDMYSRANLGNDGIDFFLFKNHSCNHLCQFFI